MECRRLQIRAKSNRFRGGRHGVGGPARCTSSSLCYSRDYSHMSTKFDAAKKVAGWCSDQQNQAPGTQGLEVPGAQENANRRATGDSAIDWIDHSAKLLPNFGRPIKALSIGCGFGPIGRILRRRDYCQLIHSIDVAESAIAAARKAATAEGLDGFAESWTNASPASETARAKRPKLNSWRTN